jgi:hypothetical protein
MHYDKTEGSNVTQGLVKNEAENLVPRVDLFLTEWMKNAESTS